jgi:hypothetical protein
MNTEIVNHRVIPNGRGTTRRSYRVEVQTQTGGTWHYIGTVERFGSLPSCQSWSAGPITGHRTRSRRRRTDAVADLLGAAAKRYLPAQEAS